MERNREPDMWRDSTKGKTIKGLTKEGWHGCLMEMEDERLEMAEEASGAVLFLAGPAPASMCQWQAQLL